MFVNLPSLSNILGKYMARPIRKTSGTGIYQVLRYALSFGAGVRQLSRLTGISFGVIQKLKMINRTDPMIQTVNWVSPLQASSPFTMRQQTMMDGMTFKVASSPISPLTEASTYTKAIRRS